MIQRNVRRVLVGARDVVDADGGGGWRIVDFFHWIPDLLDVGLVEVDQFSPALLQLLAHARKFTISFDLSHPVDGCTGKVPKRFKNLPDLPSA
ncbi:hypothetical protein D3C87_1638100 [compost metagenome]